MSLLASILRLGHGRQPKVLGVRLNPFCVGHALALHRLDSPIIIGGKVSASDLIEAVAICSQDPSQAEGTINSPLKWILLKIWVFRIRNLNLISEIFRFQNWLSDQCRGPEILSEPSKRHRKLAMPWVERLFVSLVNIGFSQDEALKISVLDAERLILTYAEMHGHAEVWSQEQDSLWEFAQNNRN